MKKKLCLLSILIITILGLIIPKVNALNVSEINDKFYYSAYKTMLMSVGTDLKDYVSDETYFEIDNKIINPDDQIDIAYKSHFKYHLVWKLPNTVDFTSDDVLTYYLPDILNFEDMEGMLKDNIRDVGTYSISGNILTITYFDDFIQDSQGNNNVKGTLTMEGFLDNPDLLNPDGEDIEFEFPGFGNFYLTIYPNAGYGDFKLNKECTDDDLNDSTTSFKITVDILDQAFKEILIQDNYGDALSNVNNLRVYDANGDEISVEVDYTNSGFSFIIPDIEKGDQFTIEYDMDIDNNLADENVQNVTNTVFGTIHNLDGDVTTSGSAQAKFKEKSKISKSVQLKDNIATYTIKIDGKADLIDQTLYDNLGEGQEYIPNSLKVTKDGEETTEISFNDLVNGYKFSEPDTVYEITYQTRITCDSCHVTNVAELNSVKGSKSSNTDQYYNKATLSKDAISYDKDTRIITWKSIFDFKESEDLNDMSFSLTDTFDESKLEYVEGSLKINDTSYEGFSWGGTLVSSGSFNEIGDGPYTITYQTRVKNNVTVWNLKNNIEISLSNYGPTYVANASYSEEGLVFSQISKSYVNNSAAASSYNDWQYCADDEHCMRFAITINKLEDDVNEFYIIDELPKNTTITSGEIALTPANDSSLPTYYNDWINEKVILIEELGNNQIKFIFKDENLLDYFKSDDYYLLYTIYADEDLVGAHEFTNKATPVIDGKPGNLVSSVASKVFGPPVTKTVVYNENTAPAANYTVVLNENAIDLDPKSDELTLIDESGTGLDFIRGSLKVNGQIWKNYSYDDNTHQLIIKVPDNTKLVITYTAYVNLTPGTKFTYDNANNSIKVNGLEGGKSTQLNGSAIQINGTTTGSGGAITLYKYLNENINDGLGNIKFKIYSANTQTSNDIIMIDKNNTYNEEFTTVSTSNDEETVGYARISGLKYDQVYVIHEEENELYEPIEDIYFVITGHDELKYDQDNIKILSSNIYNSTFNINNYTIKKSYVEILKVDENDKLLKNAKLQILDKDKNVIDEWTTDGKSHILENKLRNGVTYTLHEVSAPDGYALAKDIEFTVDNSQPVQQIKMIDKKIENTKTPETLDEGITKYIIILLVSITSVIIAATSLRSLKNN